MIVAQVTLHSELVQWCAVVHSHFLLFGIVPNSHADVIAASVAPDVEGHLEANDKDAHVEFAGTLAQSVRALKFVYSPEFGIVIRGIVEVLAFAFTHFAGKKTVCFSKGVD